MVFILSAGVVILIFWLWKVSDERETDRRIAKDRMEEFHLYRNNEYLNNNFNKVQSLYPLIRQNSIGFRIIDEKPTEVRLMFNYNSNETRMKFQLTTVKPTNAIHNFVLLETFFEGKNRKEKFMPIDLSYESQEIWGIIKKELSKITKRE